MFYGFLVFSFLSLSEARKLFKASRMTTKNPRSPLQQGKIVFVLNNLYCCPYGLRKTSSRMEAGSVTWSLWLCEVS
jgi:hypothetical protein